MAFHIPAEEIQHRVLLIQKLLQKADIDGLLVVQRVDLLYFSGTAQHGFLYIPAEGKPVLAIRKYMPRAVRESSIENMVEISSVKELPQRIADVAGRLPRRMAFELDVMPVREYEFYRRLFPETEGVDGAALIHEVRQIKSPWELEQLGHTAAVSEKTFGFAEDHLRPGYTEMEFAGMMEAFARKEGHAGGLRIRHYLTEGYGWHILSGESGGMVGLLDAPASGEGTSAAFPCGAGHKIIRAGEPVMIDFGAVMNGYHMDETRMFAIGGMPQKAYDAALASAEIHDAVLEKVQPGMSADELYRFAVDKAEKMGYGDSFLGPKGYKVTFIAHGIGMELVEPPFIAKGKADILSPGMVFALEPKITFENEFSAGVESVFTITDAGSTLISRHPPVVHIC